MAEKNSLWKNIRKNRGSGKEPTDEMLDQEKKIKASYAKGGPLKDLYDNPITSNVVNDPNLDRSYYDSRLDQIMLGSDYDQMDDYSKERTLAHENFHGKQYKTGNSTLLPTRTTYKEPSMVANDETYYGYHNRKFKDTEKVINKFKQENNSFNFVPDDVVYNKQGDAAQYFDMSTMEGEAKFYEDLGADISEDNKLTREFKYGGNMKKNRIKKYLNGGDMVDNLLPAEGATNAQAAGKFAALQNLQNAGQDAVRNFGDSYLSNKGFDQGELDIINQDSGRNLSKIPGIGMNASMIKGGFNLITGRTGNRLKNYRQDKIVNDYNMTSMNNDISGYTDQSQVTFANGGDLSMLEGPSHAEGGIQLTPEAEVEGGETKKQDYIFSDRLIIPGKKTTFAQRSKQINKMYLGKRPNDPISKQAEERELAVLQDMQEITRGEIMSNAYTKAYGGFLKKKKMAIGGNMPGIDNDPMSKYENTYNNKLQKRLEGNMKFTPNASDLGADIPADIYGPQDFPYYMEDNSMKFTPPTLEGDIQDLPNYTPNQNSVNLNPVDAGLSLESPYSTLYVNTTPNPEFPFSQALPPTPEVTAPSVDNKFGMQPADYASIGTQALSGLSQLYYGLKGPDEVRDAKFRTARPNKINMTKAKRLASQEIDNSFSGVDYDLAQTSTSASFAPNRLASAIKRARTKAETNTRLSQEEELQNASIQNNFNQFNAQVLNQQEQMNLGQEDKRIQEKDAARTAVTEGLNNIGQSVGQGVKDKRAYDYQKIKSKWLGTKDVKSDEYGNKYYTLSDGTRKYVEV